MEHITIKEILTWADKELKPWLIKVVEAGVQQEKVHAKDINAYVSIVQEGKEGMINEIPLALGYNNRTNSSRNREMPSFEGDVEGGITSKIAENAVSFAVDQIVGKFAPGYASIVSGAISAVSLLGEVEELRQRERSDALGEYYKLASEIKRYNEIGIPKTDDERAERKRILEDNGLSHNYDIYEGGVELNKLLQMSKNRIIEANRAIHEVERYETSRELSEKYRELGEIKRQNGLAQMEWIDKMVKEGGDFERLQRLEGFYFPSIEEFEKDLQKRKIRFAEAVNTADNGQLSIRLSEELDRAEQEISAFGGRVSPFLRSIFEEGITLSPEKMVGITLGEMEKEFFTYGELYKNLSMNEKLADLFERIGSATEADFANPEITMGFARELSADFIPLLGEWGLSVEQIGTMMEEKFHPEIFGAWKDNFSQGLEEMSGQTEGFLSRAGDTTGLEKQNEILTQNGAAWEYNNGVLQSSITGQKMYLLASNNTNGAMQKGILAGKQLHGSLTMTDVGYKAAGRSATTFGDATAKAAGQVGASTAMTTQAMQKLQGQAVATQKAANITGKATMDTSQAASAIGSLMGKMAAAMSGAKTLNKETSKAGTGNKNMKITNGGGSRSARRAAEEAAAAAAAAAAAEEARKEAIRKDYDLIAHKKHLNQINLEQELAMLEKVRTSHQLNAEEIMEWERKIYDAKQDIRERDAGSITKAADGIVTAIKAKYEAMQEAEMERLDGSRELWQKWRDDSVQAIEDQIAALEDLAEAEDREKKDAEELRKIAKIRQDIEFEQDEYSRMKLQQQLEQALDSREERLRKLDLQDQKEALREEIKTIEERAKTEMDALEEERKAIQEAYQERLEANALKAEAERMVMQGSQQEIIALLGEYAPEYDALGKTLGEKLLEGFQSKVGNIVDWFAAMNGAVAALQEGTARELLGATDSFAVAQQQRAASEVSAPPSITTTLNFYEPVESPAQVARRVQQVNEDLGALMYG